MKISPRIPLVHKILFAWYEKNRRDLPWRKKSHSSFSLRDPYRVLVSEFMLQQTQVSRVVIKYAEFLNRWPTVDALATARLADVIIAWKGLGYNRRAKNLLETAKIVMINCSGMFPNENKKLSMLPGIGQYTAAAIEVFAFGKDASMLDVNIKRIFSRLWFEGVKQQDSILHELAFEVLPKGGADDWYQGLMDFGSLVCTAKRPKCDLCPVKSLCSANGRAKELGYSTYTLWLHSNPEEKKESPKDSGKRFQETDRYFRGRIVDHLREGSIEMQALFSYLQNNHNLNDRVRFANLIEQLVLDGIIKISKTTVSLA